jgi:hypothetical protein
MPDTIAVPRLVSPPQYLSSSRQGCCEDLQLWQTLAVAAMSTPQELQGLVASAGAEAAGGVGGLGGAGLGEAGGDAGAAEGAGALVAIGFFTMATF